MFHKKHIPHVQAHHPRHTSHAHLDYTHVHMYARMYTCTHCGRKSHLAKFYFDRLNSLNFANKNIWVPIATNRHGPKRIWVPKFPPLVFDVGVGSLKCERIGALVVDAFGA